MEGIRPDIPPSCPKKMTQMIADLWVIFFLFFVVRRVWGRRGGGPRGAERGRRVMAPRLLGVRTLPPPLHLCAPRGGRKWKDVLSRRFRNNLAFFATGKFY